MQVTVPLRLSDDLIEWADMVREDRHGAPSRNAVLREMLYKGFEVYFAERGRK